jgi:hypothetical protein
MRTANHQKFLEADFFPVVGANSPALDPGLGSVGKAKRRILIVDDDANSTHLVKSFWKDPARISWWRKTMPRKLIKRRTISNQT